MDDPEGKTCSCYIFNMTTNLIISSTPHLHKSTCLSVYVWDHINSNLDRPKYVY